MIRDDGGAHPVKTVGGCELTARYHNDSMMIEDENGNAAEVIIADVEMSNGVIHFLYAVSAEVVRCHGCGRRGTRQDARRWLPAQLFRGETR